MKKATSKPQAGGQFIKREDNAREAQTRVRARALGWRREQAPVVAYAGGLSELMQDRDEIKVITAIKRGVPARELYAFVASLTMTQEDAFHMLGISKSTAAGKLKRDETITPEQSERLMGFMGMVQLVADAVQDSNPAATQQGFNAAEWLERWLKSPLPTLGNQIPANLLDTMSGQALVKRLLLQALEGTYA